MTNSRTMLWTPVIAVFVSGCQQKPEPLEEDNGYAQIKAALDGGLNDTGSGTARFHSQLDRLPSCEGEGACV